ncbi:hypothetical protein [Bradyrhizobium sp.]|uniref:hypothetical protein n=1 Tax=Bradyrhizobium sp. TaxID=376 RepID=UPI0025BCBF8B|nr:hypothetical protein [Bradyrhizobium sp.]
MRARRVGKVAQASLLLTVLTAGSASAYDPYDPRNCNGFEWDDKRALVVQKVTARPRVSFVKSPYDDDFKAETCPASTEACRQKAYLVAGDLVLTGKTLGSFTCISYQEKKQMWATGWLPGTALTPVAPMPSPKISDWLGTWSHPGGGVEITRGAGGKLHIEGVMLVPAGKTTNNGVIEAQATPQNDTIAFVNDGSVPFENMDEPGCRVRMQRIGPWLLVEDNGDCGGSGVTFSGLYHRKK